MKKIILISALVSSAAYGGMSELNEAEMQQASGQAGITLSAGMEFDTGTRISYTNEDAEYDDNSKEYWLVLDNMTGGVEFKNMKIDLVNNFGPSGTAGAIQVTLPEEVNFDELSVEGVYLGPGKTVTAEHQFIMGVDIDGQLQFPAETRMNIFAIK
ncbi:hypothetical protein GJQ54_03580 [Oceanospirillaceae bacterium ASx5O]|nr:hypothetical protein GJQ54_03580 [Oceanospirillaceae bacterium ASx5O]